MTWADGLSSVPPPGKWSFITLSITGWGWGQRASPASGKSTRGYVCNSLFASNVLSTLHLLVHLILQLQCERGITVFRFTSRKPRHREVKWLSKVTQLLSRICTKPQNLAFYSMFLTPTRCTRHYARSGDAASNNVTQPPPQQKAGSPFWVCWPSFYMLKHCMNFIIFYIPIVCTLYSGGIRHC